MASIEIHPPSESLVPALLIDNSRNALLTKKKIEKKPRVSRDINSIIFHRFLFRFSLSNSNPAMGNLRPAGRMRPFKLFSVALLEPLKYAYFIEKTTKSVEKSLFWPLTWHFSINLALEPIWVAHGCSNPLSCTNKSHFIRFLYQFRIDLKKKRQKWVIKLRDVHKLRNVLGGGGDRFVTSYYENLKICVTRGRMFYDI